MSGVDLTVGMEHRERALVRNLGTVALVAIAWFLATVVALQVLRDDLDWIRVPLSFYLVGPYGPWLQFAYIALASAIAMLAIGYYRVIRTPGGKAVLSLFMLGAVALAITAQAETDLGGGRELTLGAYIHAISAPLAFLGTTLGMLWQSWRFRADPRWRRCFAIAFGLAVVCFGALWAHALLRDLPRGLSQKAVVLAILAWLALAARWLRQAPLMNRD
ncbi:DUF998 domain-containing protein [Lysobacter sp. S4-A87]|uniref:DUF998 domain-containing protein n=1 Tax=Lysobacter sp. S4-A87 TaxID=2925843 RepID=UPI001F53B5C1|nr:DUF998 domain-containing protein [Lysobacter sp. S4-A87]UNK49564.1 DUF998 domain-containing protein [Lysobacter sp. S4-A87]